jgi:hypothetical protein
MVNTGSDGIFGYPDFFSDNGYKYGYFIRISNSNTMSDIRRISNIRILSRINLLGYPDSCVHFVDFL